MTAGLTSVPEERSVEELAADLDAARAALAELDPAARAAAQRMVAALDDAHRAALVHLVRGLRDDPRGKELLFALVDDPAIKLVLLMHGIIRADPTTLAQQALTRVRPQLQSHGGDVTLDRVADGVAYVRLAGACNGCSMAAVTMRTGVEQALKEQVPGLHAVEVLPHEPGPAFVPLASLSLRPFAAERPDPLWCATRPIGEFALGAITPVALAPADAAPVEAIVVNLDGQLTAYVNECAHLSMPLDEAELDPAAGTLTCPWHGYCYEALSGECTTLPGTRLEQLPLRVDQGIVWVRAGG